MNDLLRRLLNSAFDHCGDSQLGRLAEQLDVKADELAAVLHDPKFSYRAFSIRKRHGGKRQISAPSNALKRLQRRLLQQYLSDFSAHRAATAFGPGHSVARHARRHVGQELVLTVDLSDFFPSTKSRRVRQWFRQHDWDGEALDVLMRMCVYRGGLPQGAPTSPALSNLVNYPLDQQLSELAMEAGAKYSRYCDDLAFSWSIDKDTAGFREQVQDRLGSFGYQVQPNKGWSLQRRDELPEVTGVVLHRWRLRVPERIAQRIRDLQSRWNLSDKEKRQLQGLRGFRKMIKRG